MATTWKEILPTDERYYGPDGWSPRRRSTSTHHHLYFGGEAGPIPPSANVRVDFKWQGQVANVFYGPNSVNGPFCREGMNRSISIEIAHPPDYYFVFVETPA